MRKRNPGKDEKITEEKAANILAAIYEKALDGVPKVSRSVDDFANDYTSRYGEPKRAAKELVKYQILKCGTSGFVAGLGGAITLPVAIPANIAAFFMCRCVWLPQSQKSAVTMSAPTKSRLSSTCA